MEITFKPFNLGLGIAVMQNERMAVIVTTKKGNCYWLNCAQPFPTESEVKELWKYERKEFLPYYGQVGY